MYKNLTPNFVSPKFCCECDAIIGVVVVVVLLCVCVFVWVVCLIDCSLCLCSWVV